MNGHIEEMYSAHTIVKAFNGEEDSLRTFKEYNDQLYTSAWKSQFLSGLMMPLTNLIGNIGYVGVCILGGYLTIHKEIAVGRYSIVLSHIHVTLRNRSLKSHNQ